MHRILVVAFTLGLTLAVTAPAAAVTLDLGLARVSVTPEEGGPAVGGGCDDFDPAACLLPFPNDQFTREDASTPTGRRVALRTLDMPRNRLGVPIRADDYNRADGFGPGQLIVTNVPGLHSVEAFRASGLPPVDDPAASLAPDSPLVVLDADTGERHLVWAEVDANPDDPAERNLLIRPAKNFLEGHRYIVALRGLKDAGGRAIAPSPAFLRHREGRAPGRGRAAHMQRLFATLEAAGVRRDDLFLAWDFTVASARSTTGPMLSIRDRAFSELGDGDLADLRAAGRAPTFTINPDDPLDRDETEDVDGVRDFEPCSAGATPDCEEGERPWIARRVHGTVVVPCFLDQPGCPTGSRFAYTSPGSLAPVRIPGNQTVQQFTCNIPHRAVREPGTARAGIYGHGLFGTQEEIEQNQLRYFSDTHGFVFCAVDWKGMSTTDVPNAVTVLQDLSRFPTLVDHVEQGFLGMLFMGRLMVHPGGLSAHPAFQAAGGPVFDRSHLFYDGNSQGGIYGGALTAIAPDFRRATLGVPGMNYSTLLRRSVDFDTYAKGEFEDVDSPLGLYDNYPDELQRPLILSLIQMLWDRADPSGYAQHMTSDPLPNTPPHEVLLQVGFGDHQVADVTTEVQARTIGARVHRPVLEDGRPRYTDPPYPRTPGTQPEPWQGIPAAPDGWPGSAVTVWDVGAPRNPPPPAANVPPREGRDPHEDPRRTFAAIEQKSAFLRPDGVLRDTCVLGPCFTRGYRGIEGL